MVNRVALHLDDLPIPSPGDKFHYHWTGSDGRNRMSEGVVIQTDIVETHNFTGVYNQVNLMVQNSDGVRTHYISKTVLGLPEFFQRGNGEEHRNIWVYRENNI